MCTPFEGESDFIDTLVCIMRWECHHGLTEMSRDKISYFKIQIMYAIYREVHPPTGVEHCTSCHFIHSEKEQVAVASTSLLRIFDVTELQRNDGKAKLVQCLEFSFHGNIQSLNKVRLRHSDRDSLLLSFNDAKLSIVEYNPETNGLKTVSMHQFEDEEIRGGILHNDSRPVVKVDPEGRCAVMLLFGSHLAVCPFQQDLSIDTPLSPSPSFDTHDILPSYTISLRDLPEPLPVIKDMTFIEGYTSPTLLFLSEISPTWAGRISLRQDSMMLLGLSLNTSDKSNTVIWTLKNLPFDSSYLHPVPKPLGGVLVFGANTLIYLNQSSPPYGLSLNSITDYTTRFLLKKEGSLGIRLDCSQSVFISNEQLLVSLQSGDIYIVTLFPDSGMRGVKRITFDKAASSILSSCICSIKPHFLFLGSRLANSLLLRYSTTVKQNIVEPIGGAVLDLDDIEVYGESAVSQSTSSSSLLTNYSLEVCDSLLCIGPVVKATIGEPAFLSEEFVDKSDLDLELVLCSGHGKNGALSVLQRTIRPQVVTTFELPGCIDMWTVKSEDGEEGEERGENKELELEEKHKEGQNEEREKDQKQSREKEEKGTGQHDYLILSRSDSTMVLQTGQEITELDQSGFATQSATVFAGNVGSFIVQATRTDIRLLKGVKQLCYVALDMGGGVKCVDVCSPYVIVLLMEGEIGLLKLVDESLVLSWPSLGNNTPVNLISAYTDTSGLFDVTSSLQFEGDGPEKEEEEEVPIVPPPVKRPHLSSSLLYDEDELLYGPVKTEVKEENTSPMEASLPTESEAPPPTTPTHWCLLCKEDGALEIYSVPEFQFVFAVRNFSVAPWTLCDSGRVPFPSSTGESMGGGGVSGGPCNVEQVLCVGMGLNGKKPHIMAFINKELVIYEAFRYTSAIHPGHLKLRFSKAQHNVILQDKRVGKLAKHFQQQEFLFPPHLRKFSNIAGYSGVFVCGPYPHWIFMAARGHISIHPMYIDGPVQSFAPFDNVNCPSGFLYFNKESELRISVLPTQLSYDSYWPVRKVPLKATPHFVGYHMESKVHVIIASTPQPVTVIPDPNGETEDALETVERDGRFVSAQEESYYLQLLSPTSWETIPHSKYEMEAHYHVTDMKVMRLRSQETLSGRKEYIVVGTMATFGEELSAKGKVLIFDVSVVIPEPGKPFSQYRLKNLYDQEQKWPVTGLECVNGLILTAMGQKIFMWQFKDNKDLLAVAFIDAETYIHTAQSIKGFILTGDVTRSIQLLHYNEDRRSLSLISQDPNPMEVFANTFMIDGKALGFLVSDSDKNITLFQYQPENPASSGGANLIRCGDIHVGSLVNVFLNIRCKTSAGLGASREMKIALADKRQCTFFGTLDGGIGCLLPIPEKVYRRLSMLQVKMTQGMRHMAGLNPKSFRTFQTRHQYLYNAQRNILDGTLLYQYLSLTAKEKFDFSKQIGTTVAQILEDLKEIDKVMSHF